MDSSRVPIGSGQLTADPRRIHCHEPDIVQYVNFFSTLLEYESPGACPARAGARDPATRAGGSLQSGHQEDLFAERLALGRWGRLPPVRLSGAVCPIRTAGRIRLRGDQFGPRPATCERARRVLMPADRAGAAHAGAYDARPRLSPFQRSEVAPSEAHCPTFETGLNGAPTRSASSRCDSLAERRNSRSSFTETGENLAQALSPRTDGRARASSSAQGSRERWKAVAEVLGQHVAARLFC